MDTKGTNESRGWYKTTSRKIFLSLVDNLCQAKWEREILTRMAKVADKETKAPPVRGLLLTSAQQLTMKVLRMWLMR